MRRGSHILMAVSLACGAALGTAARAQDAKTPFAEVDAALATGAGGKAIDLLKQLARDPDIDVRCEARYRHAMLLLERRKFIAAAVLLRAALDEKPHWKIARIQLARAFALMGREPSGRRELRQAQAKGLPAELQPFIDNYNRDLLAVRPVGGSIEVAFAPSSNIHRPSVATLINNSISPYSLTDGADDRSGNGVRVSSQLYGNTPISDSTLLSGRFTLHDNIFRQGRFNDHILIAEFGTVTQHPRDRVKATFGQIFRVYGDRLTSTTSTFAVNWLQNLGHRDQMEVEINFGNVRYDTNTDRNGQIYTTSAIYEHAFTARSGGRVAAVAQRQSARIPGYANTLEGIGLTGWQEFGRTTLAASLAVQHLEADAALPGATARRNDWLVRPGFAVTFRRFRFFGFAPAIRASYEWNFSTVARNRTQRLDAEFALNRAF
ncbi:LPS-assembly protein LptD [Sphingomonas sp. SUN039]|uniref:LPS-assembly protein LptD n=1 Tax=Sphingomonas sp. SUN039 TaxID=2937787 RepID=UPI00216480FA|nr:LPS-assembly protein LptD [Sphingomonas sp. SUN039]UVO52608.1 LPS-assembly protein LptD [Sphingomonas sp. SUN039]